MEIIDDQKLSHKLKAFLTKKLQESEETIKHLQQKHTIIRSLYYTSTTLSIIISTIIASITQMTTPPIVYTLLAIINGVLTATSMKFNFEGKALKIHKAIENKSKLKAKLDYIISCNGHITEHEFKQISCEFN